MSPEQLKTFLQLNQIVQEGIATTKDRKLFSELINLINDQNDNEIFEIIKVDFQT